MSTTASRTAQYIAQAGSPADLTAGVITLRTGTGPQEVVDASLNLYKIIDAFYQLTDKHPALKVLPLLGLGNALRKASLDISATGAVTRANQLSLVGEVLTLVPLFAPLAVGGPVTVPVLALLTAAGVASSFCSSALGYEDKQIEIQLTGAATALAESAGLYDQSKVLVAERRALDDLQNDSPWYFPAIVLLRFLSPNTSVAEALSIVDASAVSVSQLQESATVVNAIRQLVLGQTALTMSSPEDYLTALEDTYIAASAFSGKLDIRKWPSNASALVTMAQTDANVRAAMVQGAAFYITGQLAPSVPASDISIYDPSTQQGTLTSSWLKERAAYLSGMSNIRINEAGINTSGAYSLISTSSASYNTRYIDAATNTQLDVFSAQSTPTTLPTRQVIFGSANIDVLQGAGEADRLFGGAGADILIGGAGDDYLEGGSGKDDYQFAGSFGHDTVFDTDGQGNLQINGQALSGTFKGIGQRGAYALKLADGSAIGLAIYDDAGSATGKSANLRFSNDDSNAITVKNFSWDAAVSTEPFVIIGGVLATNNGYLGIKIDPAQQLVLAASGASIGTTEPNPWQDLDFTPENLAGKESSVFEGAGRTFTVYLNQGAKAGETLVLRLAALANQGLKAILGDTTVEADGATITLAEGQTQVSFAIVQDGELDADVAGSLSVTYTAQSGEEAVSNAWGLNLQDAGEADATVNGDFNAYTEINTGPAITRTNTQGVPITVVDTNEEYFLTDAQGNLLANLTGVLVTDNTLYGSAANDAINGLSGNDLMAGDAGNDTLDGGAGDDMIGGGSGNDAIDGGDGDDYISSSAGILAGRQQIGPNDRWSAWGQPAGSTLTTGGAMWGVYPGDGVTVWNGIGATETDAQQSDSIDGGAGNDWIMASWGSDRLQGGEAGALLSYDADDEKLTSKLTCGSKLCFRAKTRTKSASSPREYSLVCYIKRSISLPSTQLGMRPEVPQ